MARVATTKTTKQNASNGNSTNLSEEINKLAYQYYVERGYQDGFHEEDWLRAEAAIKKKRS